MTTLAAIAAAATATTRRRTVIRLSISTALVHRRASWSWLHKAEDEGLHLKLSAHAPTQAHFHLTLHTHPIHFWRLFTSHAAELLPTVLKHPLDFPLSPE